MRSSESSARTTETRPAEPGFRRTRATASSSSDPDAEPKRPSTSIEPIAVLGIGRPGLDAGLSDLRLERARRALGDDLAVVDDPDPVGEPVGLLEVLGGQEDGHPLLDREPLRPPPRASCGSAGRGRSSARRGRGSGGCGRGPARGRGDASCRPSSRRPCDPPPRRGRRARSGRRRGCGARSWGRPGAPSAIACARGRSDGRRGRPPGGRPRSTRGPGRPGWRCRSRRPWPCRSVGGSSVVSIRTVVDLPAPFGPRKP